MQHIWLVWGGLPSWQAKEVIKTPLKPAGFPPLHIYYLKLDFLAENKVYFCVKCLGQFDYVHK